MKSLTFSFLLTWFIGSNATLTQDALVQALNVPKELATHLIERIKNIDQLNTSYAPYYPILSQVFIKERGYKVGCEIGVFTGGHAEFTLANSDLEKLFCIDSYIAPLNSSTTITNGFEKCYWQACWDTIYYYAIDKLSQFSDRVKFIRLSAEQAAPMIEDYSLDFVFIDGDHSYDAVLADCTNYYNKVRSGGIVAGDDYNIEDVSNAVQYFFKQKNLAINIYPGQARFWWVEKP
jgi:hypothetical protein